MSINHTLRLDSGHTLAVTEYGDPSGHPVLFCHGWPGSRVEARLADSAARTLGVRLIAPDRPGIGDSPFVTGRRILDWPETVTALAAQLLLDTFGLLAVSGGTPYALACAISIPERIRGAGICCGLPPLDLERDAETLMPGFRRLLKLNAAAPMLASLAARVAGIALRTLPVRVITRPLLRGLPEVDRRSGADPEAERILTANLRAAFKPGARGMIADGRLITEPWGFDPSKITMSIHFWHGARDTIVPIELAERMITSIPNASYTRSDILGHYSLALERITEILEHLVDCR